MLLILTNLFCWIPAVLGYGIALALPRKRLSSIPNEPIEILVEPLFGLLILSILANGINFQIPIDHRVSLVFMLAGWILCGIRLRMGGNPFTRRSGLLIIFWLLFLSFWATQVPHNFDSGLYHMQSIQWFNESALPFGLANLHGRFGYNSAWFSTAAVIQLPVKTGQGVNCLSISALLIFFFGIALYKAWHKPRNLAHTIFLILSALLFTGAITRGNISSPSPDLAVVFLCVVMTYLAMEVLETKSELAYRLFQLILLGLFAFTIKFSSLPLILIPLSMVAFLIREKIAIQYKPLIGYICVFAGILFATWMLRGIAVSGCLSFPIADTCFEKVLWTFPRGSTEHYWLAGKASARLTYPFLLPFREWFGPWFSKTIRSIDFLIPVTLMFVALLIHFLRREKFPFQLRWIVLPHIIAITLWFFSAPDIRFAAGYFWSLSLLLFSAVSFQSTTLKQKAIVAILLCVLVWIPLRRFSYFGYPPVLKAARNPQNFVMQLPIPQAKTTPYFTREGVKIYESNEQTRSCWLSDLPCTPYFDENLKTVRNLNGDFEMFYYSKPGNP